jgi:hypothetical protein
MILNTVVVFPNNAVELIAARIPAFCDPVPTDLIVHKRPLRSSDERQCVGVWPASWAPIPQTTEMLGKPNFDATLNRYTIAIQGLIMDMDEEKGLARHSILSAKLRAMLYRDAPLRVGLTALSVTDTGGTEHVQRCGVNAQRYIANEVEGSFIFLSNLEVFLETETR